MHQLIHITIQNYRSCRRTEIPLAGFTPIVGYNNAGKSNILNAIEWLLQPDALNGDDFNQAGAAVVMEGIISGVTESLLDAMPANQGTAIKPYVANGVLHIRRSMAAPGAATSARLEVRNPAEVSEEAPEAWSVNPTGLQSALKILFPDCIRVRAMEDAGEDVGKSSKSNTIGKLIAAIVNPIRAAHDADLKAALAQVAKKLSAEGDDRAAELVQFDEEASGQLAELFPGLGVRLDIPAPEVPDLFKSGFIKVLENIGTHTTVRKFEAVGHGAQRCVQMALIRYLAEKKAAAQEGKRTLLLVDEPELYLHPQGVEQVRQALHKLSIGQYQVVFTTHNPLLLHREQAGATIIVRKPDSNVGTIARMPMTQAINGAIQAAPHQARMLFDLSRSADVFFSDRVLLSEGKTEGRLIPILYERIGGQAPRMDKVGLVSMGSVSDIPKALAVLKSMQIEVKAIADLDFAFVGAGQAGLINKDTDPELLDAKRVLQRMQGASGIGLAANGLPERNSTTGVSAADAWALFAKDAEGNGIVARQHAKLLAHGIWCWKSGAIEDVLGYSGKSEEMIQSMEAEIMGKTGLELATALPEFKSMVDWFRGGGS